MPEKEKIFDIKERTLNFAGDVIRFVACLFNSQAGNEIAKQLIRSGASIGANLEEAYGAVSKKDFVNKVGIARKEARETRYWLRLIDNAKLLNNPKNISNLKELTLESDELSKILSSIIITSRKNN